MSKRDMYAAEEVMAKYKALVKWVNWSKTHEDEEQVEVVVSHRKKNYKWIRGA
jgi:hypothetical protein